MPADISYIPVSQGSNDNLFPTEELAPQHITRTSIWRLLRKFLLGVMLIGIGLCVGIISQRQGKPSNEMKDEWFGEFGPKFSPPRNMK